MSAKILNRLHTDHQRIEKVLQTIESFATDTRDPSFDEDIDKLFCLVEYVAEYPDQIHHPFEDEVFALLLQQDLTGQQRTDVDNNITQHAQLKEYTDTLMNNLLVPAAKQDKPALRQSLSAFVELQREHMGFEENTVFPLAKQKLTEAQWQSLDETYAAGTDPLFDANEERFEAIFNYVVDAPYGEVPGDTHKPTIKPPPTEQDTAPIAAARAYAGGVGLAAETFSKLGEIQSNHFNALMSDCSESLRQLATSPPPAVLADHLRRRTTHNYEIAMEMMRVFSAEAERWRHLQSRS